MLIAVDTRLILEVEDDSAAELASASLDDGLAHNLADFPGGEVVTAEVKRWAKVSDEEANEKGWVE